MSIVFRILLVAFIGYIFYVVFIKHKKEGESVETPSAFDARGFDKHGFNKYGYGLDGREEAHAYMEHPILSKRLIEATEAVLNNKYSVYEIFGNDTIKFRACMLLFSTISDNPVFKQVIEKYRW